MIKRQITRITHGIIYLFTCTGLVFGQTACSFEKLKPPATPATNLNKPNITKTVTPVVKQPLEKTLIPSPTGGVKTPSVNGSTEKGNIVITFADISGFQSLYKPLMEEFHRENPSITVNFVNLPEYPPSEKFDRLKYARMVALSADTVILPGRRDKINPFFLDLQSQFDRDGQLNQEDFWPNATAGCQDSQGHMLGLPYHLYLWGVFYDEQAFYDAGLPVPQPGWTWDDFRKDTAALSQQNQDEIHYGFAHHFDTILSPILEKRLEQSNGDIPVQKIAQDVQWYLELARLKALYPVQGAAGADAEQQAEERWHKMFQKNKKPPAMWSGALQNPDPGLKIDPGGILTEDDDPTTHLAINRFGFAPFPVDTGGLNKIILASMPNVWQSAPILHTSRLLIPG